MTPEELRRRTTEEASGVRGSMRSPDEEGIDAEFLGEGENLGRDAREVCSYLCAEVVQMA